MVEGQNVGEWVGNLEGNFVGLKVGLIVGKNVGLTDGDIAHKKSHAQIFLVQTLPKISRKEKYFPRILQRGTIAMRR